MKSSFLTLRAMDWTSCLLEKSADMRKWLKAYSCLSRGHMCTPVIPDIHSEAAADYPPNVIYPVALCLYLIVIKYIYIVDVVGDSVLPGCPLPAGLLGLVELVLGLAGHPACPLLGSDGLVPHSPSPRLAQGLPW